MRKTHQVGKVDDGHYAGVNGFVYAGGGALIQKVEIGFHVKKVLGDGTVGACVKLALQETYIAVVAAGFRMDFRVGGDLYIKVVAGALPDEGYQLVGIDQLHGRPHARGHVAAQRYQPLDASFPVGIEQGTDRVFVITAKTQVGCYINARIPDGRHHPQGGVAGAAASAVSYREKLGVEFIQGRRRCVEQFVLTLLSLGREILKTDPWLLPGHDSTRPSTCSCRSCRGRPH